MKRYFIALFILPLLLVACDDDKLEMMHHTFSSIMM